MNPNSSAVRLLIPLLFWACSVGAQQITTDSAEYWDRDTPGIADAVHPDDLFGTALATCDFNLDGYDDLAIGAPGDAFFANLVPDAGNVQIIYGSAQGLTSADDQVLYQNSGGDLSDEDDLFGSALAAGDFNDDNYCDLAVGTPGEDVNGQQDAGSVHVFFGSEDGLGDTSAVFYQPGIPNNGSSPEPFDLFGATLAAGDFNGDNVDDLAVGAPLENQAAVVNSGHVMIYHGSDTGLQAFAGWTQFRADLQDSAETGDEFGSALAAADFDGDGYDDLAVGAPGEDVDGTVDVGAVHVIRGSMNGLTGNLDLFYSEHTPGIGAAPETGDRWGSALAAGDFDEQPGRGGVTYADLAIGAPNESVGSDANAGAVSVLYGSGLGPLASTFESWTENGLPGGSTSEPGDQFGFALAAGDLDGDGIDDLVVGHPFENSASIVNAGAITVIYGADGGLTEENSGWFRDGVSIESSDYYGSALAIGDFDGNGGQELAIGAPNEDLPCSTDCEGDADDAGAVHTLSNGLIFADGFEGGIYFSWSNCLPAGSAGCLSGLP